MIEDDSKMFFVSMWKHIGKNPEYVMIGDSEENHKGKPIREPMVIFFRRNGL